VDLIDLIVASRERIGDRVEPYFVSDQEWTRYANQAQIEAAERSLCLLYEYVIPVASNQASYPLDPSIIIPVRARLTNSDRPLVKTTQRNIDRSHANWEAQTGYPRWFFEEEHQVRLYPTPEEDDVLIVSAYAYPLTELGYPDNIHPEIEKKDHYFLTHWMCWEALSKYHGELYDEALCQRELALFERRFGSARSSSQIRHWRELPPNMRVVSRAF